MSLVPDAKPTDVATPGPSAGVLVRSLVIGTTAFLTLVDLFATQAVLPALARHYDVTPAEMSFAVNASTFGMAVASLGIAWFSKDVDRRVAILASLAVLAVPTALLATAPDLVAFTILRVIQGLCMASAFTLTLAHLGEACSAADSGSAFAAYVTGNVASNLVGRLISAAVADHFGLASNFYLFAGLNLAGALLVYFTVHRVPRMEQTMPPVATPVSAPLMHLRNGPLRAAFGIGFCILFSFIGTFTYVNFVLVRPPLALGMMALGLIYLVFLPSIITTPLAGRIIDRFGTRPAMWAALGLALAGLPLLLVADLAVVLAGMVLVAAGTFFAQATATGFVGQAARVDRSAASGLYLASYFAGGLVGSTALGQLFDAYGWHACVIGIALSLVMAMVLAGRLVLPPPAARHHPGPAGTQSGGRAGA